MNLLQRLICKHEFEHHRDIHGDEIITWGGKRSLWFCKKCWKFEARDELGNPDTEHAVPTVHHLHTARCEGSKEQA